MKPEIVSKRLLTLGLVFVLWSAITAARGQGVVTIHSIRDVSRGETSSFVLDMNPAPGWAALVNFSVSGTAIPGVDYVPLISPVLVWRVTCPPPPEQCTVLRPRGRGVILVKTLPDPRGPFIRQAYSVVVTLEPGPGYAIGQPSSATMMISP